MNNDQEMELACDLLSTAYKETHRSSTMKTLCPSGKHAQGKNFMCVEVFITWPVS
jgi:hypothetical protein